jgi:D-alanyl-lipoteichoic acid acyltransferase DltB (MBOAT superfamily)
MNLGMLAYFKYFNFFRDSIQHIASSAGIHLGWTELNIVLPVGISFYTFHSMSYTIDVYRGQLKAERSWPIFAFVVSYFPQLIAGPIVRPHHFLPQVHAKPRLSTSELDRALHLTFQGLFKKIVLGDFLAVYADHAFNSPGSVDGLGAWLGVYAFAFQIYFDFSGYSDIAIGCALAMGYRLTDNFARPYAATSFSDFWRRWHISLSSWLRDYLYISLGGNRMKTSLGVYRNLMITMLLGGLWHGAAWHYVLWGFLHGLFLCIERLFRLNVAVDEKLSTGKRIARTFIVFHCVLLAWITFRVNDVSDIPLLARALCSGTASHALTRGMAFASAAIVLGWAAQLAHEYLPLERRLLALPVPIKAAYYAGLSVLVMTLASTEYRAFIYFQF